MTLTELDRNLTEWGIWARSDSHRLWYPPKAPLADMIRERSSTEDVNVEALTFRVDQPDSDALLAHGYDVDRAWLTDCRLRLYSSANFRHYATLIDAYFRRMTVEALRFGEALRSHRDYVEARGSRTDPRREVRNLRLVVGCA